jgi:hypothetical protein
MKPEVDSARSQNIGESKGIDKNSSAKTLPTNAAITRYGIFQVQAEENGDLHGRVFANPAMLASGDQILEATVRDQFRAGDADLLLIEKTHGASCLATYTFFTVTAKSVSASPEFGTCAEAAEVKAIGGSIQVSMPGFKGPFETEDSRTAAAGEQRTFTFSNGRVKEESVSVAKAPAERTRPQDFSILGAWNCGDWTTAFFADGTTLSRTHSSIAPSMDIAGNYSYRGNVLVRHDRYLRFVTANYSRRESDQWQVAPKDDEALQSNDLFSENITSDISRTSFRMAEVRVENWNRKSVFQRRDAVPNECKSAPGELADLTAAIRTLPFDLSN